MHVRGEFVLVPLRPCASQLLVTLAFIKLSFDGSLVKLLVVHFDSHLKHTRFLLNLTAFKYEH